MSRSKTHLEKILSLLAKNTNSPGVTTAALARSVGDRFAARVYELRNDYGFTIYTNTRKIAGSQVHYYRLSPTEVSAARSFAA